MDFVSREVEPLGFPGDPATRFGNYSGPCIAAIIECVSLRTWELGSYLFYIMVLFYSVHFFARN